MLERLALRLATWKCGVEVIGESPWIGHGVRQVEAAIDLANCGAPMTELHSDWLFLAYAFGIPVALTLLWLVVSLGASQGNRLVRAALWLWASWCAVKPAYWFPGSGLVWLVLLAGCVLTRRRGA